MAPRIRVLTSGGVPPATLNGETLYAGKVGCIGSGKHATDKSYLYRARKLQQEVILCIFLYITAAAKKGWTML